jgi:hypothetical protein
MNSLFIQFLLSAEKGLAVIEPRYASSRRAPVSKFGVREAKFGGKWSKFGLFSLNSVSFGLPTERYSRKNSRAIRPYAANRFLNSVVLKIVRPSFFSQSLSGAFP